MDSSIAQAPMITTEQIMATQIAAAERLEAAQREVRIAGYRIEGLVADALLRYKAEATDRYRRAEAELDAAQADFEAAQDLDCPEED